MSSPFPGMDPWLERRGLWPDVHDSLIMTLRRVLVPLVSPKYYIAARQRTVFAVESTDLDFIVPDVSVVQRAAGGAGIQSESTILAEPMLVEVPVREKIAEDYLEVVEASTHEVITVIEILSWSNKTPGRDRHAYERKRERIFQTSTHLVEIDLLRAGEPMPFTFLQTNGHFNHYRILVKRGDHGRRAYLYPFNVREAMPIFTLPLQAGDHEPPVRLGEALKQTYDEYRYDLRLNYNAPPEPPLSDADAQWAAEILQTKR